MLNQSPSGIYMLDAEYHVGFHLHFGLGCVMSCCG